MQITPIENNIHRVARLMYFFAGMAIVAMMMITTLDVFMRFCVTMYSKFGWEFLASWRPVPGTYDLVAMCGAIAAAFAMAHTTLESGHVAVSLVVRLLSKKGQLWMKMFTDTASLSLFSILTWRSVTMQLPYHPFVYLMAFSSLVVALVYLIAIIKNMKKVVSL
jgi:TRAP-type C4-dicarboxylate transport system permease small subunit